MKPQARTVKLVYDDTGTPPSKRTLANCIAIARTGMTLDELVDDIIRAHQNGELDALEQEDG